MQVVSLADGQLSLFGGSSFHLDGDDGLIVKGLDPFGMIGNRGEYGVHQLLGTATRLFTDNLLQPLAAEKLTLGTCGVEDSIAEKEKEITRMPAQVELIICRVVEQSDRQTGRLNGLDLPIVAMNRTRQAGIRNLQQSLVVVPDSVDHGDVLTFNRPFRERQVDCLQHACRAGFFAGMGARDATHQSCVNGGRSAFAAHVSDSDASHTLPAILQKVIQVAADLTGGSEARGHLGVAKNRHFWRQQSELKLARKRQVLLQALFLARDLLVQRGVLNRDRHLCGQRGHDPHVVLGEVVTARMLDVENADHLVFIDQRNAQLRAGFRVRHDVAGIFTDIGDEYSLPMLSGVAHQPNAQRDLVLELYVLLEAQGEAVLQEAPGLVEQKDGKHLVIDDAGHQVGNALQQLINVEDGCQLAADFGEQGELSGLARDPRVQTCILDPHGNARGEQRQQTFVLFRKGSRLIGFDVNHPDYFVLGDERHSQLGTDAGGCVDDIVFGTKVVDQHGLARLHRASGDALANFDADALRHLGSVPDLKPYAQLLCFLIQQQYGEDFIVDEPLQHLGHAL